MSLTGHGANLMQAPPELLLGIGCMSLSLKSDALSPDTQTHTHTHTHASIPHHSLPLLRPCPLSHSLPLRCPTTAVGSWGGRATAGRAFSSTQTRASLLDSDSHRTSLPSTSAMRRSHRMGTCIANSRERCWTRPRLRRRGEIGEMRHLHNSICCCTLSLNGQ